jgi:hypothetical protein
MYATTVVKLGNRLVKIDIRGLEGLEGLKGLKGLGYKNKK